MADTVTNTEGDYTDNTATGTSDTYAQIVVPSYDLVGTVVASSTTTTGSSFLRLGSFPSLSAGDDPNGFAHSLTLAQLVGDASAIVTAEPNDNPAPSDLDRYSTYAGDENYLLGFVDDTRYHSSSDNTFIDWVSVTSATATRQAETQRLLTKGGWWDHSDGNRITTTSGDKIEVIQGNYKLVILGRQDPTTAASTLADNTFITDVSAGLFEEQGPDPTPCIKTVEWVEDEGVWTLFQDNGTGNVTTKIDGKQCDYYTGTKKEAYVGVNHETQGIDDNTANKLEMISKTWAKSIESYTGSLEKSVTHALSYTYVDDKEDYTFAASIVAATTATSIVSTNTAASIASTTIAGVDIVSVNVAPLMVGLTTAAAMADIKIGNYFAFGTNKTFVHGNSSTFEGGREVITATKTDLTALETSLAGTVTKLNGSITKLAGSITAVAGDVTKLNEEVTEVGGAHTRLAFNVTMLLDEFFLA